MHYLSLALPLAAAIIYVAGAIALKRASELKAGVWQTTVVANVLAAICFQALLCFGGTTIPLAMWWQPLIVALLFLSGQIWTIISLKIGDVSVATPVLGLKILLVALFTTLLIAANLGWQIWTAAALMTLGIVSINHAGARRPGSNTSTTIVTATLAAASLALFDVFVQKWVRPWGLGRFLPLMMGMVGVLSLPLIALFPRPLFAAIPRDARRWILVGGSLFAIQSVLLVSSIAHFKQATVANVIYSSRGLWSVMAVAIIGRWLGQAEGQLSRRVLQWRFAGAGLMFAAIALLLL